jgi:hypothetical protein
MNMKKSLFLSAVIFAVSLMTFAGVAGATDFNHLGHQIAANVIEGLPYLGAIGMTTLAKDAPRTFVQGDFHNYPVIAADIIYQGAAVGDNGSGYARPLQAGDPFRGFADYKADNAAGTAGAIDVRTRTKGRIELNISGLAITDVGKDVYASDDDTFTLTQGSNTRIGYVVAWVSTGVGIVEFEATSAVITELTDGSTGTASDSIGSISDTATKNAVASLTAKVNQLIRRTGN